MKRLGKFYINRDFAMSEKAAKVFIKLQFVPYRVELLATDDKFEYIGTSPLFASIEEGMVAPEYKIDINEHRDNEISIGPSVIEIGKSKQPICEICELKNEMQVHVICCNDSVEFAVIGDEDKAKEKMAKLKAAYYERNKWSFENKKDYNMRCYWHIHTVDGEK